MLSICVKERLQSDWVSMERTELRELLRRKEAGGLDGFVVRSQRKKESESDLLNLLQTWTHSLLYYKAIYPPEAFHQRQMLGIPLYVALSPPLRDYLDAFFAKLRPLLSRVNHLQLLICTQQGAVLETNTLHIDSYLQEGASEDCQEEGSAFSQLQKEIHFKSFLGDLKNQLQGGFKADGSEEVTFKLRVGYRLEEESSSGEEVIDGWMATLRAEGTGKVMGSLVSPLLNLIYERSC